MFNDVKSYCGHLPLSNLLATQNIMEDRIMISVQDRNFNSIL